MSSKKDRILAQLAAWRESEHFWVGTGVATVSLFGMVTAFAVAPGTADLAVAQRTVVEQLDLPKLAAPQAPASTQAYIHTERVQRGDSIASLMARLGVQDEEAVTFLRTSKDAAPINRQMRPGKSVTARTGANGEFLSLAFPLNGVDKELVVEKKGAGFVVTEKALQLDTRIVMKSGEIRSSLFAATDMAGLPDAAATQLADIFGGDVDFHKDLRKGDRFSVVYEMVYSRGEPTRAGRILAAEFINDGRRYKALYFQDKDGKGSYYTPDGRPLKKAFLRSPLEFSRVTSGFTTSRFHPVLQTWRAHKGVDYGAPQGTGVRATADGSVQLAGRQGGYGNVVILRHQGNYSTVYGHLRGFAPGVRTGSRVHQGDIIGYVGMTGLASGPHLHYEFRIAEKQVNPLSVALPTALPLPKEQVAAFKGKTGGLLAQLDQIRGLNLAQLN